MIFQSAVWHPVMGEQPNKRRTPRSSRYRVGFTLVLVAFSAWVAVVNYPYLSWLLCGGLGLVAGASIFLRVGWATPCMIAGVYVGMILDAHVKGGTAESQMYETVWAITLGAAFGLVP